jgi:hypothetical protein
MLKKLVAVVTLCGLSFASQAALLPVQIKDIGEAYQATDFTAQLEFDQFDTLGGTRYLTKIKFGLLGKTIKRLELENNSTNSASKVEADLQTRLVLRTAGNVELITALPAWDDVFNLDVFDGTLDYLGTSGVTVASREATKREDKDVTLQSILNLFTGTGTITTNLFGSARDLFGFSGGNVASNVETRAHGTVFVQYEYALTKTPVSEPGTIAIFGLALAGLAVRARRRQQ